MIRLRRLIVPAIAAALSCAAGFAHAAAPPAIPPIADANRVDTWSLNSVTDSVQVTYPIFGDCTDLVVTLNGTVLVLNTDFTCASAGNPDVNVDLLPLPITDMVITFSSTPTTNLPSGPPSSGTLVVTGAWHPRRTSQPTAPGINRREFNDAISTIVAGERELYAFDQTLPLGNPIVVGTTPIGGTGACNNCLVFDNSGVAGMLALGAGLDISGGDINLQPPGLSALGGVDAIASLAHNWISYIDTNGQPHQAQPAFSDISGTIAATQLPAATGSALGAIIPGTGLAMSGNNLNLQPGTASVIGGVESIAASPHEWISSIVSGVPILAQPSVGDIANLGSNVLAALQANLGAANGLLGANLNSAQFYIGNASNVAASVPMSGDATMDNTGYMTLASSGVTAGTYGDGTHVARVTFDAKGRGTSASAVLITPPFTSLTGTYGYDFAPTPTGTNDTTALQALLTALGTNGGGKLYLGGQSYIVSTLVVPADVGIEGPGTITLLNSAGQNQIVELNGAGAYIRGVTINGNSANNTMGTCVVVLASNTIVENNTLNSCPALGVLVAGNLSNIRIKGNVVSTAATGGMEITNNGSGAVTHVYILDNLVKLSTANQGILLGMGSGDDVAFAEVRGNKVYSNGSGSNGGGGIWFDAATEGLLTIDGNQVYSNNGDNISVTYLTTGSGYMVTVANNISYGALGPPADPNNSGIVIDGATPATVTGNIVYQNSGPGILIRHGATHDTLVGNVAYDNSHNSAGNFGGIQLGVSGDSTLPSDITVLGNKLYDDQGTITQSVGILISSGANSNVIKANTIKNATTAISNSGTSNILTDNVGYNPVGTTGAASTGTSGSTITAGPSPETHYIKQSASFNAAVTKGGQAICTVPSANVPCVVQLGPYESYTVSWSTTQPTYTKDVH